MSRLRGIIDIAYQLHAVEKAIGQAKSLAGLPSTS